MVNRQAQGSVPQQNGLRVAAPALALPKGGGASRGIGEKFATTAATGAGSLTVPIPTSPGRSGFGPQLVLSYDSNAGNGPFGIGWNLSVPAITRKTDRGIPRYQDADESDVFVLSGSEDLVPVLEESSSNGEWKRQQLPDRVVDGATYRIQRYRPRVEGSFARIERWTNKDDARESFWRSISRENVTAWYGRTSESRISDPADPARIFGWFLCETYDDKGNAAVYRYKAENSEDVDTSRVHERNRTPTTRQANRYLKRIRYGNRVPHLPELSPTDPWPTPPSAYAADASPDWFFETVLDYGEHDDDDPVPNDSGTWDARQDPFSTYRQGFEIRSYRLCQRVLMFHHFANEGGVGINCLIRSTELEYSDEQDPADARAPIHSRLVSVIQSAYKRVSSGYHKRSLPPLEFEYSRPEIDETVRLVDPTSLENLPAGVDGSRYEWVDLDGEGVSGILTEQGGSWLYKRNLSPLNVGTSTSPSAQFAATEVVARMPSTASLAGGQRLLDLSGNGLLDVVTLGEPVAGFFERTSDESWSSFAAFTSLPNIDWSDPNLRFADLTGDGFADVLITEDEAFTWYPSLGQDGFGAAESARQFIEEEDGPRLVFNDGTQSVYLSDLSGDGMSDLVRIRNGEVCYWPNLGYGRFGAKVTMDASPWFDTPDQFDQSRVRLADVDGSGTTDLLYLSRDGVDVYFNQSGNSWSAARRIGNFPRIDDLSSVMAVDLFGNGTACLVWSSPLPGDAAAPLRYIDLMGGHKPHLVVKIANNLGAETELRYAPSTKFYLADKLAGTPWVTKLPFPVHVVERVTIRDKWRRSEFASTYSYHHGYFDGVEREFRGFGRVEQLDVERYDTFAAANAASPYVAADQTLYQPPVKTVTWFHTGAFVDPERILSQFREEYFPNWFEAARPNEKNVLGSFAEHVLLEPELAHEELSDAEWREALRACKGMQLRHEVYELDVDALHERNEHLPVRLFSSASRNWRIRRVQPKGDNKHGVFLVGESEAITYSYELDLRPRDLKPDPRVTHALNLTTDELGNVLQSVTVAYGRVGEHDDEHMTAAQLATVRAVQGVTHIAYGETYYTNDVPTAPSDRDTYRLRVPCEVRTCELTGFVPAADSGYFSLDELRDYLFNSDIQGSTPPIAVGDLEYHELPNGTSPQKRLVEHRRSLFVRDDLQGFLPFGQLGPLGLRHEEYELALTDDLLDAVFDARLDEVVDGADTAREILEDSAVSGYLSGSQLTSRFGPRVPASALAGQYWRRSGTAGFHADAPQHFYLPERYIDPFGQVTQLAFDGRDLFPQSSTDPAGNVSSVDAFDYRVMSPRRLKDANDNLTEVAFDVLGLVIATAALGKGSEGDNLTGFTDAVANPTPASVAAFCGSTNLNATQARNWLKSATSRVVYHFGEARDAQGNVVAWSARPAGTCTIQREIHASASGGAATPLQIALECSDGTANVMMRKTQAEPKQAGGALRWIVGGKTVVNNKGNPVKQFDPYFSDDFGCEILDDAGMTPLLYYDALSRLVRTERPDGALIRVEFSPWSAATYDQNDTVLDAGNAWYAAHSSSSASAEQQRAAQLAAEHANTPSTVVLDSLGRQVIAVAHTREDDGSGTLKDRKLLTVTKLDAEGRSLWMRDARRNLATQSIRPPMSSGQTTDSTSGFVPCYDIVGNQLFERSMDAGDRWMLPDAAGNPLFAWTTNEHQDDAGAVTTQNRVLYTEYDAARRPVAQWLTANAAGPQMLERFVYGESLNDAKARNLRGRLYRRYDASGRLHIERVDFKGNPIEVRTSLSQDFRAAVIDWQTNPDSQLESEEWMQSTERDALSRVTRQYNWHRGVGSRVAVNERRYNERGVLANEDVVLRATRTAAGYTPNAAHPAQTVIAAIQYNARGQPELVRRGNGTTTRYAYDPATLRLTQLRTTRPSYNPAFPNQPSALKDARVLQNLLYTYDAAGNITEIRDDAYEPAFFKNQQVDAVSWYVYDPLYRLISASGRESDQSSGAPVPLEIAPAAAQFPITNQTLRNYTQEYEYDDVGNIMEMRHLVTGSGSWTRHYQYESDSNRLKKTWRGNNVAAATNYAHDTHGNVLNVANVPAAQRIRWDHRDMIRAIDLQGGGWAYYNYDWTKSRTRRINAGVAGGKYWERIYLDGFEMYRRFSGSNVVEEIESLHVMLEDRRILLVDDVLQTDNTNLASAPLWRFQYCNHLNSTTLEADNQARIISMEEFHPYGTSAYRVASSGIEAPPNRYRYTGMERDPESGLYYHGARYSAPWLARWLSADPSAMQGPSSRYEYGRSNPLRYNDPDGRSDDDKIDFGPQGTRGGLSGAGLNVDEPLAVGEGGIPDAERMRRAKDIRWNRQLLDFMSNQGTKRQFKEIGPGANRDPLPDVSIKDQPSAIFRPSLGTVKEWKELADILEKKLEGRLAKVKSPFRAKEIINDAIRAELKNPTTEPGRALHNALRSQLPDKPTDWFRSSSRGARFWGKTRSVVGKSGAFVASAMIAHATSASAAQANEAAIEDLKKREDELGRFATDNPEQGILIIQAFWISYPNPDGHTSTFFRYTKTVPGWSEHDAISKYYNMGKLEATYHVMSHMEYRFIWIPPLDERLEVPVQVAPPR